MNVTRRTKAPHALNFELLTDPNDRKLNTTQLKRLKKGQPVIVLDYIQDRSMELNAQAKHRMDQLMSDWRFGATVATGTASTGIAQVTDLLVGVVPVVGTVLGSVLSLVLILKGIKNIRNESAAAKREEERHNLEIKILENKLMEKTDKKRTNR